MTTYTSQPAEADGIETYISDDAATTNYGTDAEVNVGAGAGGSVKRTLIKFDLSKGTNPPEPDATITSATLTLYLNSETSGSAVTLDLYKCLRNWVESQATWNAYSTGNNWATAGCGNITTDRANVVLGQLSLSATEAAGAKAITLDTDLVQGWLTGTIPNYGLLGKTSNEDANTRYLFASSTDGTASHRPKLVIEYTESVSGSYAMAGFNLTNPTSDELPELIYRQKDYVLSFEKKKYDLFYKAKDYILSFIKRS